VLLIEEDFLLRPLSPDKGEFQMARNPKEPYFFPENRYFTRFHGDLPGWIEAGRYRAANLEEDLEKGLEKGREATLNLLRRLLQHRFGLPLDYFDQQLTSLDLATLTHLSDQAFEVESLTEFEAALAEVTLEPKAE
jgi:hypothetical protein